MMVMREKYSISKNLLQMNHKYLIKNMYYLPGKEVTVDFGTPQQFSRIDLRQKYY